MTTLHDNSTGKSYELPPTTALEILRQAGDMIEVSYWIKSKEIDSVGWENWLGYGATFDDQVINPAAKVKSKKFKALLATGKAIKGIKVFFGAQITPTAITQMCSIGALGMARLTDLDEDTRPYLTYEVVSSYDFATRVAGEALADTIRTQLPGFYGQETDIWENTVPIITSWNDDWGRTRKEVVEVFRKAEKHPLLQATELWSLSFDDGLYLSFVFASEAQALESARAVWGYDRGELPDDPCYQRLRCLLHRIETDNNHTYYDYDDSATMADVTATKVMSQEAPVPA